ncbi:MAG: superoxide dismutase, Fe-Mn family [Patescibacteria group bacterium]|jgi:Fe-Mn family superoxide dismutase|nr:superoxide dismutase, Fe-Mn family [Patescibacteria group bacterium]
MFELPKLKYEYDALEPFIDAKTIEIHHTKHHGGYVDKLNRAIEGTELEQKSIEEILSSVSGLERVVRNNAGGHWNHSFFWEILSKYGGAPGEIFAKSVEKDFGSFDEFKNKFTESALSLFGSGWVWLIKQDGILKIVQTSLQDNPLMDDAKEKGIPILGIDVWEHAYYLKHQNKRADYVSDFWNVVNWNKVEEIIKNS